MKWFKHFSDSLDDPFIQELLAEFSHKGYVAYFGILEVIAKENGMNLTGKIEISPAFLKQKFHISERKLLEIYKFCDGKLKLFFDFSEKNWKIDCPKLLNLRDNYSYNFEPTSKKPSNHKEVEEDIYNTNDSKIKSSLKPKPKKEKPSTDHKLFIEYFVNKFKEKTTVKYHFDGGKDGNLIKALLGTYELNELKKLCDVFFESKDEFILKAGYSIGVFKSTINKLISGEIKPEKIRYQ